MFSFPNKNQEILLIQILHFWKNAIRDIWLWVTLLALVNVIVIVGSLSIMVDLHGPSLHLLLLFTNQ